MTLLVEQYHLQSIFNRNSSVLIGPCLFLYLFRGFYVYQSLSRYLPGSSIHIVFHLHLPTIVLAQDITICLNDEHWSSTAPFSGVWSTFARHCWHWWFTTSFISLSTSNFLGWVLVVYSVTTLALPLEGGGPNRSQHQGRHACPELLICKVMAANADVVNLVAD